MFQRIFLMSSLFVFSRAALVEKPVSTTAVVGQDVSFFCKTNLPSTVYWGMKGVSTLSNERFTDIYETARLKKELRFKYDIKETKDGRCELIIKNVTYVDAGTYKCQDNAGVNRAEEALAELIVIDDELNCVDNRSDTILASDICGLNQSPDYVNASCSLKYKGNRPPILSWKRGSEIQRDAVVFDASNSIVISSLVFRVTEKLNGSAFSCEMNETNASLSHTFPVIEISHLEHAFIEKNLELPVLETCSVDTNLQCSYNWIRDDVVEKPKMIIQGKTLNLPSEHDSWNGTYRCRIECRIRDKMCIIQRHNVHVFRNEQIIHHLNTNSNISTESRPDVGILINVLSFVLTVLMFSVQIFIIRFILTFKRFGEIKLRGKSESLCDNVV